MFYFKAPVTLEVSSIDDSVTVPPFRCFEATSPDGKPVDPCSSHPCSGDLSALFPQDSEDNVMLKVKLCSDAETNYQSSIWELNFSRMNDSMVIEGNKIIFCF